MERRLRKIINGGLLGARSAQHDQTPLGQALRKISDNSSTALREIGAESDINKRRVEQFYGVPMNPQEQPAAVQPAPPVTNVQNLGGVNFSGTNDVTEQNENRALSWQATEECLPELPGQSRGGFPAPVRPGLLALVVRSNQSLRVMRDNARGRGGEGQLSAT